MPSAGALSIKTNDGVTLAGEEAGAGPPIVLLHGLTATRRYVVMGSRLLERSGHRVIAYDARGHGRSTPARTLGRYGYELLTADLERCSTPSSCPGRSWQERRWAPTRRCALRCAAPIAWPRSPSSRRRTTRQRLRGSRRRHRQGDLGPESAGRGSGGVRARLRFRRGADRSGGRRWRRLSASASPPTSTRRRSPTQWKFSRARARSETWSELQTIRVPALVVASRDEIDPGHPLALAERYAAAIPEARLAVEEGGPPVRSPLAWQGGQLSKLLAGLAARAA